MGIMLKEWKLKLIAGFIEENWALFVAYCECRGDDAEALFEEINK